MIMQAAIPNRRFPLARISALAAIAVLSLGAGKPAPKPAPRLNWNNAVALTPAGSHVLGNPAAEVKLTEYVSYTCSHCAHFETEADGPLRIGYIHGGKVSVEVRHMLRDPIDLTAAMLTNCGAPAKFFLNHTAIMRSQDVWLQLLAKARAAQRQRWTTGDQLSRRRAIAADFKFYEIMSTRGYDRMTLDRCLADQSMAQKLAAQSTAAAEAGVNATPSFAIDGVLLTGTHDWSALEPQIKARL